MAPKVRRERENEESGEGSVNTPGMATRSRRPPQEPRYGAVTNQPASYREPTWRSVVVRQPRRIEEWSEVREARCRHCGEPIWQGLIWKHRGTDDQQCADGMAYAEPREYSWHPPGGSI